MIRMEVKVTEGMRIMGVRNWGLEESLSPQNHL